MSYDEYIGTKWAGVFKKYDLPKNGVIAEIASGGKPKIAHGLNSVGFSGTLLLVDPAPGIAERTALKYRDILPKATIIELPMTLQNLIEAQQFPIDVIVANHPLDDMILHAANPHVDFEDFETQREIWQTCNMKTHMRAVADIFNCLETNIVISQYRSGFFLSHSFNNADDVAQECAKLINGIHTEDWVIKWK